MFIRILPTITTIMIMMIMIKCCFQEGAILVFMPGWEQIKKLHNMLLEDRLFASGNTVNSQIFRSP